ncbi:hypothetical protein [Breznakibacter xylanolyticus]|nr:hypothetical protein [Breznakibacter xylanolyticus]
MKQLHEWKYIQYKPSFNPHKPSMVSLKIFKTEFQDNKVMVNDDPQNMVVGVKNSTGHMSKMRQLACQKWHRLRVKNGTHCVSKMTPIACQKCPPYINNTNNKTEKKEHEQKNSNLNSLNMKNQNPTPAPRCSVSKVSDVPPPIEHVKIYFLEKKFSDEEAEKFFNYFQSIGWLVGGRTKMRDWKAAARNWMLNVKKFAAQKKPQPPKSQIIDKNKSYDIPL